jgi:hypothetical protein
MKLLNSVGVCFSKNYGHNERTRNTDNITFCQWCSEYLDRKSTKYEGIQSTGKLNSYITLKFKDEVHTLYNAYL